MGIAQAREKRLCYSCNVCHNGADDESTNLIPQHNTTASSSPGVDEVEILYGDNGVSKLPSIIQFQTAIFFCQEDEGEMSCEVIRMGSCSSSASVNYETMDSSAKAGRKYEPRRGTLHFKPGDSHKLIPIKIIEDDAWDSTLEFKVQLSNARGATLGKYLSRCSVMIIDDDLFPTNKYKRFFEAKPSQNAEGDSVDEIPSLGLMIEYAKMNFQENEVLLGTIKTLLLDQVKNLYFFLTIWLQMYLIDVVLAPHHGESGAEASSEELEERRLLLRGIRAAARLLQSSAERLLAAEAEEEAMDPFSGGRLLVPHSRKYTATVVGLLYILPFALLQFIDIKKARYGIAGIARKTLQTNLLRKFLNYKEESRQSMSSGDITMAMVRDVKEVVELGFMKMLEVVRIVGKLMLALFFILAENKMAVIPLLVYPVIMGFYLCIREVKTIASNEEMADKQNGVVRAVNDAVKNYRLLADFDLRSFMVESYEEHITEFNESEVEATIINTNNRYLAPWLITLLIGVYFIISTQQVTTCGGVISLGTFLATINVFKEIGIELAEIYVELMEIQKATGPLRKIAVYMNKETNMRQRMNVSRRRRDRGEKQRQSLIASTASDQFERFAADCVDIEIDNVSFSYPSQCSSQPILHELNGKLTQGKLYAFVGPPHQGKATFLRLLGQVILVDQDNQETRGEVFIPPHLRVLHVSPEPYLLHEDLLTNIVLNQSPIEYGGIDRVKSICAKLNFSAPIKQLIDEMDGASCQRRRDKLKWMESLSHTDHARLTLARSFVFNPEFMVMHKPTLPFNDDERRMVVGLIKSHVAERGLMWEGGEKLRRPRTVCFTSSTMEGTLEADAVFKVSSASGLELIEKDEVERHPSYNLHS